MIFPIVLGLPPMFFPIPPLMVLIPATLSFGVQIPPAIFGCAAVLAVVVDRFVQSHFRFFDGMLAPPSFVGMHQRGCHKQQKCPHHDGCYN